MNSAFTALLRRDLLTIARRKSDWMIPLAFFAVVTALFPLGTDIDQRLLARFAPGIVWVAALLASILTLDRMFKDDFDNGSLEQFVIAPCGLYPVVLARVFSHWCSMGLPLLVFAPLYAYMLGLPPAALSTLIVVLLLATPVLSALGAIGAALTVGLRQGSVLLALLMLPLYVPLLIFSTNAVDLAASGHPTDAVLAILGAMLIVSVLLAPWLVCAALRVILD